MKNKRNALNGFDLSADRSLFIKITKNMKKRMYVLIFPLVVVIGLMFANCETKNETSKKTISKPLSAAEIKAKKEKWEASPDGINYKKWETSPKGKQVLADAAKIRKQVSDSTSMEAVVTALSLPPDARLGFGVMAKINDVDYILSFGLEKANEFQQLRNLKVNDKIIIKGHSVSYAPKYAYAIISGGYVEQDGKMIYKRAPRKDGC